VAIKSNSYPVSLTIDYPGKLSRLSSFFRIFLAIPIIIILSFVAGTGDSYNDMSTVNNGQTSDYGNYSFVNERVSTPADNNMKAEIKGSSFGIAGGLFVATALMILFRQRYPRWWFDFNLELSRFSTRVSAFLLLMTDKYPSTEETQTVHLDIAYPDARKDIKRWMPLVKWLLALPHYIVLFFLYIGVFFSVIIAWFAILFTGRYPKGLFDFIEGVLRWSYRLNAYAFLLVTDKYPPFSLK